MNSTRLAFMLLAALLMLLTMSALAEWSQGGSMAYVGDLNLMASSFSAGNVQKVAVASTEPLAANNTTENNTSQNSTLQDISSTGQTAMLSSALVPSSVAGESTSKPVLDLSGYANDRTKGNLTGYTNIMYPITGSRGTTTSTAGGGGACGGCGS